MYDVLYDRSVKFDFPNNNKIKFTDFKAVKRFIADYPDVSPVVKNIFDVISRFSSKTGASAVVTAVGGDYDDYLEVSVAPPVGIYKLDDLRKLKEEASSIVKECSSVAAAAKSAGRVRVVLSKSWPL